ncbi:hypothetical protein ASC77_14280 [Nocardioides sp. Root1257]|uniref:hypothetical protein n=1 Tax=unclassified Nocardioides TaxID=2615069 RepID=UPI0006F24461|nr:MULTISPECIES: hypothetical protein [unclassified Nocardioides]KQW47607.1 hypothetical protein ASC77_14280 [Nocardioides sp. Root1257]KRC45762.1 hypothetical protein ASE24_14280 [Nocardioides sp. Root224]
MDGYARHVKANLSPEQAVEMQAVDGLAEKLLAHIVATTVEIANLHVHGAKSKAIQDHFAILLREELGFGEEVVLTPQSGLVTRARPDFFFELADGRGIIAEVERGGTTTNNHDLKDLWKAHVAPDAHHLFLIVPHNNWRVDGSPRERPFPIVARRLGAFFGDPRREIDVVSVHVFGY